MTDILVRREISGGQTGNIFQRNKGKPASLGQLTIPAFSSVWLQWEGVKRVPIVLLTEKPD